MNASNFTLVGRLVKTSNFTTQSGWDLLRVEIKVGDNEVVEVSGLAKRFQDLKLTEGDLLYIQGSMKFTSKEVKGHSYYNTNLNADRISKIIQAEMDVPF